MCGSVTVVITFKSQSLELYLSGLVQNQSLALSSEVDLVQPASLHPTHPVHSDGCFCDLFIFSVSQEQTSSKICDQGRKGPRGLRDSVPRTASAYWPLEDVESAVGHGPGHGNMVLRKTDARLSG